MQCPRCGSERLVKAGFQSGKQRYRCKDCSRAFVEHSIRGKSPEMKAKAVSLYLEGLGFRAIGRILGVSNVSVLKWIRQIARHLPEPAEGKTFVDVLEMDELWHFVQKKRTPSGSGLVLTVCETPSVAGNSVVVVWRR